MAREEIRNKIVKAVKSRFGIAVIPDFSVEVPENPEYGDYSTNVAFVLAKTPEKPPVEIAQAIAGEFKDAEVVSPGFINFRISSEDLIKELKDVLSKKEKYGRKTSRQARGKKIQIEFISANPTGPLTLANGRGGFLGDALANVLQFSGYPVEREYYVNDTGNQIFVFGKSLLASAGIIREEEDFYKGAYIKKWVRRHGALVKKLKDNPVKIGQEAAREFLREIKKSAGRAKIKFDRFTSEENHIHKKGFIKEAMRIFERAGKVYRRDGAVWLKTADFGDGQDHVLVTRDNFPTYFLADAGHYLETKKRGFGHKILILGPDHYGYVKRIQAAARLVGLKKSEIIITQAVRLVRGGREVKMSKRAGEFVTFEELLKRVGLDAARYFFLEKSPDTHIDFDMDLAKERSAKNPVYYIQYAHARMASIFRKVKSQKSKVKSTSQNLKLLESAEELSLIKKLIQFPDVIADTTNDYQVHRLTRYALELARIFHNFYEKHRVVSENKELTEARLSLVKATQIVLKNVLDILGVSAPSKM